MLEPDMADMCDQLQLIKANKIISLKRHEQVSLNSLDKHTFVHNVMKLLYDEPTNKNIFTYKCKGNPRKLSFSKSQETKSVKLGSH